MITTIANKFLGMLDTLLSESRRDRDGTKEKYDALVKVVKSATNLKRDLERLENAIAAREE